MEKGFTARVAKTLYNTPMPRGIKPYSIGGRSVFEIRDMAGKILSGKIIYLVTTHYGFDHCKIAVEFKPPMSQTAMQKKLVGSIQEFEEYLKKAKPEL